MAMRIITLEKLGSYIKDTTDSVFTLVRDNESVKYVSGKDIVCEISNSDISNPNDEQPFLKFRDQVEGKIKINGVLAKCADIQPYSYLLD